MNSFVNAINIREARTENGMKALHSTGNACTNLFFKIGASRGKNIVSDFVSAFVENKDHAVRVALWARDARSGAGERQIYRDILQYLEKNDPELATRLIVKTPELGRWDDLLSFQTQEMRSKAFRVIAEALYKGDGLAAKWMPRKGNDANDLRRHMKLSPKAYRKLLVNLTNVVETQMCAKEWDSINFEHVPSLASARYKKAFLKNAKDHYTNYLSKLENGEAKVNAGAVYPYDVIKTALEGDRSALALIKAQWESLPDYTDDTAILPMVDVSGSMTCSISPSLTALNVALSLGLYLSEKNKSAFKDCFLTFSSKPELYHLTGNIIQKLDQMRNSSWQMSTDLHAAFNVILNVAKKAKVPESDMPKVLLILSDMQFNSCAKFDNSAYEMISRKYEDAGYQIPNIVFWNLNAKDNAPVKFDQKGVALVSGFSPSIMKSVLKGKDAMTPENVMMNAIMNDRYNY
jgi:hypothetical protein